MLAVTPRVCQGTPDRNLVSIFSSFVLNKVAEADPFFFNLFEFRPDALGQFRETLLTSKHFGFEKSCGA